MIISTVTSLCNCRLYCGAAVYVLRGGNETILPQDEMPRLSVDAMMTREEARRFHAAFPEIPLDGPGKDAIE